MNSLVGYEVSSESEDEAETPRAAPKNEENAPGQETSRNFLLESGSASSESGSNSESEDEREEGGHPVGVPSPPDPQAPPAVSSVCHKLPPPALTGFCVPAGSSVFSNPFKERAEEKLSALQKHVSLTPHARPSHIGGRKVCVAYRKNGRCRFGIRCKFAHDSDLHQNLAGLAASESADAPTHTRRPESAVQGDRGDGDEDQSRRKKQRVGVSDSLIPPKRALRQYALHRDNASHTHTHTHTKRQDVRNKI